MIEKTWPSPFTREELIQWKEETKQYHDPREQYVLAEPGVWNSGPDASHVNRYMLAKAEIEKVEAEYVADCASGVAYGGLIMQPKNYTACDVQDYIVEYAERFSIPWIGGNAKIIKHDLTKTWPFEDATLDLVTSFETLEHVDRMSGFILMNEAKRVLRQGGTWFVSSPLTGARQELVSHFHVKEWEFTELFLEIAKRFKVRRVYTQTIQEPALVEIKNYARAREKSDLDKIYYVVFKLEKL